jgi:CAS/CSE protein, C-terminus
VHRLTAKMLEVCANPVFAAFNHYLFEAVAALISAARGDAAALASLEQRVFAAFDVVLQRDVQEFHPYVFQVFALLIVAAPELRPEYLDVRFASRSSHGCGCPFGMRDGHRTPNSCMFLGRPELQVSGPSIFHITFAAH